MLRTRSLCRFALLPLLVALLFTPHIAHAMGEKPPAPTKLRVKMVEIKNTKVRLPIPDGYEEMRREDHPGYYSWMVSVTLDETMQPLAYFINSEDKALLQQGKDVNLRYGFAFSDESFWDAVIWRNRMDGDVRQHFVEYIRDGCDGVNEIARKENRELYDWNYIHSGKRSIAYYWLSKNKILEEKYRRLRIGSYIVLDRKIVGVSLYIKVKDDDDIALLRAITTSYLTAIDQGRF